MSIVLRETCATGCQRQGQKAAIALSLRSTCTPLIAKAFPPIGEAAKPRYRIYSASVSYPSGCVNRD